MRGITINGSFILALFLLSAPGCKKSGQATSVEERSANAKPSSSASTGDRSTRTEAARTKAEPDILKGPNDDLLEMADGDLIELCKATTSDKAVSGQSDEGRRLVAALRELFRRGNAAGFDLINALPPGYLSENIVWQVFSSPQEQEGRSLSELLDHVANITDPDFHRSALQAVVRTEFHYLRQAEADLPDAERLVATLRDARVDDGLLAEVIVYGVAKGQLDVDEISKSLSGNSNTFEGRAIEALPLDTMKELTSRWISEGKPFEINSVGTLAHRIVQQGNPVDAMQWVESLPAKFGERGMRFAMSEWMASDPRSASKYVGTMPDGPLRDVAVQRVVQNCIMNGDYESATHWSKTVSNEAARLEIEGMLRKDR